MNPSRAIASRNRAPTADWTEKMACEAGTRRSRTRPSSLVSWDTVARSLPSAAAAATSASDRAASATSKGSGPALETHLIDTQRSSKEETEQDSTGFSGTAISASTSTTDSFVKVAANFPIVLEQRSPDSSAITTSWIVDFRCLSTMKHDLPPPRTVSTRARTSTVEPASAADRDLTSRQVRRERSELWMSGRSP